MLAARKPKKLGFSLRKGALTYQPGRINNYKSRVNPKDVVAKLVRHDKRLDCAISRITTRDYRLEQFESNVIVTSARMPKKGDIVEKSGTRTGVTRAKVEKIDGNWVYLVPVEGDYPHNTEISMGGDSGSVWYDPETKEGLILHSRGDDDDADVKETASGFILVHVLKSLGVSLTPKA